MTVLGLTNKGGNWAGGEDWSGSGYHRILLPLASMEGVKGLVSDSIQDGLELDIIVYNRVSQYDSNWEEVKSDFKCKIVLDMDDYWYPDYQGMAKRIERNIKQADLVLASTPILADKIRLINPNVIVVENGIPFGHGQFTTEKLLSEKIRIFWAGGMNHNPDLKMFKNAINYKNKLLVHKDKIEMVIGGYNAAPDSIAVCENMLASISLDGKLPNKAIHVLPSNSYMTMYRNADIMVIPLEDNEFNSCKSILKVLEAASKKIPVIVSNVKPYSQFKDMPVLWINSPKDWFTHLNYLILNSKERIDLGIKLYEWAKERFNLDLMNAKRNAAFNTLVNN